MFVDCLLKRLKLILFLVCGVLVLFAGTMTINALSKAMTIGLMSNYEAVSITEIVFSSNNSSTLTIRNEGYTTSIINSAYINGVAELFNSKTNK